MGDGAEVLRVEQVLEKWGITACDQVRDILGFSGDASDNIPGIPGVGPKTAQKLITQYGTLENALDHFAEQKGKLKESLEKFRDQALLSKRLATIDVNVPIPFEPEVLRIGPRDEPALRALLTEFEFNNIGRRIFGDEFKAGRSGGSGSRPDPDSLTTPAKDNQSGSGQESDPPDMGPQNPPMPSHPRRAAHHRRHQPRLPQSYRRRRDAKAGQAMGQISRTGHRRRVRFRCARCECVAPAFCFEAGRAFYFPVGFHGHGPAAGRIRRGRTASSIGHDFKPALRNVHRRRFSAELRQGAQVAREIFDTALAHSASFFPTCVIRLEFVAESLAELHARSCRRNSYAAVGQQDFLVRHGSAPMRTQVWRRAERWNAPISLFSCTRSWCRC